MSNRVSIQICEFVDHMDDGTTVTSYGYRICDDYESDYKNLYDSLAEVRDDLTEEDILDFVETTHPNFLDAVRWKGGLYLNGDWIRIGKAECEEHM